MSMQHCRYMTSVRFVQSRSSKQNMRTRYAISLFLSLLVLVPLTAAFNIPCTDSPEGVATTLDMSTYQSQASSPSEPLLLSSCVWVSAELTVKLAPQVHLRLDNIRLTGGSFLFENCKEATITIAGATVTDALHAFSIRGPTVHECTVSFDSSQVSSRSSALSFIESTEVFSSSIDVQHSTVTVSSGLCHTASIHSTAPLLIQDSKFTSQSSELSSLCPSSSNVVTMGIYSAYGVAAHRSNWTAQHSTLIARASSHAASLGIVSRGSVDLNHSYFEASYTTVNTTGSAGNSFMCSMSIVVQSPVGAAVRMTASYMKAEHSVITSTSSGISFVASMGLLSYSSSSGFTLNSSYFLALNCTIAALCTSSISAMAIVAYDDSPVVLESSYFQATKSSIRAAGGGGHFSSFGITSHLRSPVTLRSSYFKAIDTPIYARGNGYHVSAAGIAASSHSSVSIEMSQFDLINSSVEASGLEHVASIGISTGGSLFFNKSHFLAQHLSSDVTGTTYVASMGIVSPLSVVLNASYFLGQHMTSSIVAMNHVANMGIVSLESLALDASYFVAQHVFLSASGTSHMASMGIVSISSVDLNYSYFQVSHTTVNTTGSDDNSFASSMSIVVHTTVGAAVRMTASYMKAEHSVISATSSSRNFVASMGLLSYRYLSGFTLNSSYFLALNCTISATCTGGYISAMGVVTFDDSPVVLESSYFQATKSSIRAAGGGGHFSSFGIASHLRSPVTLRSSYFKAIDTPIHARGNGNSVSAAGIATPSHSSVSIEMSQFDVINSSVEASGLEFVASIGISTGGSLFFNKSHFLAQHLSSKVTGSSYVASMGIVSPLSVVLNASYFLGQRMTSSIVATYIVANMGIVSLESLALDGSYFVAQHVFLSASGTFHMATMGITSRGSVDLNYSYFQAIYTSVNTTGSADSSFVSSMSIVVQSAVGAAVRMTSSYMKAEHSVISATSSSRNFVASMGLLSYDSFAGFTLISSYFLALNCTISASCTSGYITAMGIVSAYDSPVILNDSYFLAINSSLRAEGAASRIAALGIVVEARSPVSLHAAFFHASNCKLYVSGERDYISSLGIAAALVSINLNTSCFYALNSTAEVHGGPLLALLGIAGGSEVLINFTRFFAVDCNLVALCSSSYVSLLGMAYSGSVDLKDSYFYVVGGTGISEGKEYVSSMGIVSYGPVGLTNSYFRSRNFLCSAKGTSKVASMGVVMAGTGSKDLKMLNHSYYLLDSVSNVSGSNVMNMAVNSGSGNILVEGARFGTCNSTLKCVGNCHAGAIVSLASANASSMWVHSVVTASEGTCLSTAPLASDRPSFIFNMSFTCKTLGWEPYNASWAYIEHPLHKSLFPTSRSGDEVKPKLVDPNAKCDELLESPEVEPPELPELFDLRPVIRVRTASLSMSISTSLSASSSESNSKSFSSLCSISDNVSKTISETNTRSGMRGRTKTRTQFPTRTWTVAQETPTSNGVSGITAMEEVVPAITAVAFAGTGSTSALLGGIVSPGGASGAIRGNLMFRAASCKYVEDEDEEPSMFEHIIQLSVPSDEESPSLCIYLGSALVTLFFFVCLPFFASKIFWKWQSSRSPAAKTPSSAVPFLGKAQRYFLSPLSSVCMCYFLPCVVSACVLVLAHANTPLFVSLATFALVLVFALQSVLVYDVLYAYPVYIMPLIDSKDPSDMEKVAAWLAAFEPWVGGSRDTKKWYFRAYILEDVLAANLIAVLAGARPGPDACFAVALLIMFVSVAHAAYVIALRPYRSKIECASSILIAVIQVCIGILCSVIAFRNNESNTSFAQALGVFAILQNAAFVGQMICVGFWAYFRMSAKQHSKNQDAATSNQLDRSLVGGAENEDEEGNETAVSMLAVPTLMNDYKQDTTTGARFVDDDL